MIERFETTNRLSKVLTAGNLVFLSGLTAQDKSKNVRDQTLEVLEQIDRYLTMAGTDKRHIVSANIWLTDVGTFAEMNEAWESWVDPNALPARATVGSPLAGRGSLVEIQVQAIKP